MKANKKFTLLHRILHWTMFIAMPILFITGFLRMYWMNKKHIVSIISENTSPELLTKEQMSTIATSIREPMWQWHELFAHIMIITFVIRIIYMLTKGIRFPNPFKSNTKLKEKLQGFTYIYFYLFVFISAVTGICIEKGFFESSMEIIETVHKLGIYWFPIFIILHIAGILIAELTDKKGIVSNMIGGD
ncbi:MAG TPA: cytochrome b/b6 domain-containing protein [Candidatus Kapabacteria bacterium]|nr:cytochrome b/b6 domain-containing protein [Candidatus Kapabacteria bacterium]